MSIQMRTSGYHSWAQMRARCNRVAHPRYMDWGGRGICICERWSSFKNFIADMGPRPSKNHSIDRIDNDGNYEPSNCRWATSGEQCRNKRIYQNNTTGINGVMQRPDGKYLAGIRHKGKYHHLYYGDDLEEAARKRKNGEAKYWRTV